MYRMMRQIVACLVSGIALSGSAWCDSDGGITLPAGTSERLLYNNDNLIVDLGVGLWALPLPMDYDEDGDYDMVVATVTKPSSGIFIFENTEGDMTYPVFSARDRIGEATRDLTISYVDGEPRVLSPGLWYPDFRTSGIDHGKELGTEGPVLEGKQRARQWRLVDYDGDGLLDNVVGLGVWAEYGWDDAYNVKGEWTNGPLHGYVYVCRNTGTNEEPAYAEPEQVMAENGPVDTYGAPSPNFDDFDGDGDLDLICGEFVDKLIYYENIGSRTEPRYRDGRFLQYGGMDIHLDLCMLQVIALDWNKDGNVDLVVGQEDGRVALMEHTGRMRDDMPEFLPPRFFEQKADILKVGALSTPYGCDWDGDGDEDLIVGDTAGYLSFVENLDGGDPPSWAEPVYLRTDGDVIRIMAGPNGSIQGPAEEKWGYTVLNVADWNNDGLLDIVANSIWGKVVWYENAGKPGAPELKRAQPIRVAWDGPTPKPEWFWWNPTSDELVTQWRTTPLVFDWNGDELNDLIMLDQEGYLSLFERKERGGELDLLPPSRVFFGEDGAPLRLNEKRAGGSGRRKLALTDWDGDGLIDLLVNGDSVELMRNVGSEEKAEFRNLGSLDARKAGGHSTCPTVVDWNKDGIPDLVYGAEDGFFYYLHNPRKP